MAMCHYAIYTFPLPIINSSCTTALPMLLLKAPLFFSQSLATDLSPLESVIWLPLSHANTEVRYLLAMVYFLVLYGPSITTTSESDKRSVVHATNFASLCMQDEA